MREGSAGKTTTCSHLQGDVKYLAGMVLNTLPPFASSRPYLHVSRAGPQPIIPCDNCRVDSGAVGAFACGRLGLDISPSTIQAYLPNTSRRTGSPYATCARGNEAAHRCVVHFDLHLPASVVCLLPTAATITHPCTYLPSSLREKNACWCVCM